MSQFKIKMISSLDIESSYKNMITQLPELEKKLNSTPLKMDVKLDISNSIKLIKEATTGMQTELNNIKQKFDNIFNNSAGKSNMSGTALIKNDLVKITGDISTVVKEYEKLGKVKVTPRSYNENGDLKTFIINLERAQGLMEKIYYAPVKPKQEVQVGNSTKTLEYEAKRITEIDKTAEVAKKASQQEAKAQEDVSSAIQKTINKRNEEIRTLERRQSQAINKGIDTEIKAQNDVSNAIARTMKVREEDRIKLEQASAKVTNKNADNQYLQTQKNLYGELQDSVKRLYGLQTELLTADKSDISVLQQKLQLEQQIAGFVSKKISTGGYTDAQKEYEVNKLNLKLKEDLIKTTTKVNNVNFKDDQTRVYKEMESSVNRIYSLKKQLIGADEQQAIAINKSLQAEQQLLITLNQEKNAGNGNGSLVNKEKELALTSQIKTKVDDLSIAQGKNIDSENRKLAIQEQSIANTRKEYELKLQLAQQKFGTAVKSEDVTSLQRAMNNMTVGGGYKQSLEEVNQAYKQLTANAQPAIRSSMNLGDALKEAFSKFPKMYGEMVA